VTRSEYYKTCIALAQEKRAEYAIQTHALDLNVIRAIYRAEQITIDQRPLKGYRIKAAYYCENGDCSVLVNSKLPREPKLFALTHELKHHYLDRKSIADGQIQCGDYNAHEVIEKGAEVFAAAFIYPEAEMRELVGKMGITNQNCGPEAVVQLKRESNACVSYTFIVKRLEWFGLCARGAFNKVQFTKVEERLFGVPIYKRESFKRARARKKQSKMTGREVTDPF
jgi:Zn-dependent peptidase ImmA (M78 family)